MTAAHIGLDIGGTGSRWVACDETGAVLARGQTAGATGHVFNPNERARLAAALQTIASSLGEQHLTAKTLTAGITGYGSAAGEEVKALAHTALGLSVPDIVLADDIVLAYAANFAPGEGHVIAAGTGSIGVHVTAGGELIRVGGRGILIDDAGSGSWIALQALDHMYRVLDHSGSFAGVQHLADALFADIGGASWSDVRQFVYGSDRGRIGTLSLAVARAAHAGDVAALSILRSAGAELAQLAKALSARVGTAALAFTGGVIKLHPVILDEIIRRLPDAEIQSATADAALAAARLHTGRNRAWAKLLPLVAARA